MRREFENRAIILGNLRAQFLPPRGLSISHEWTVNKEQSFSRSRNTPFHARELKGRAVRTIVGGKTVWSL